LHCNNFISNTFWEIGNIYDGINDFLLLLDFFFSSVFYISLTVSEKCCPFVATLLKTFKEVI
jgi:hypothetical protein